MPRMILETPYLYSNDILAQPVSLYRSRSPVSCHYIRRNVLLPVAARLRTCSSVFQLVSTGAKPGATGRSKPPVIADTIAQTTRTDSKEKLGCRKTRKKDSKLSKSMGAPCLGRHGGKQTFPAFESPSRLAMVKLLLIRSIS